MAIPSPSLSGWPTRASRRSTTAEPLSTSCTGCARAGMRRSLPVAARARGAWPNALSQPVVDSPLVKRQLGVTAPAALGAIDQLVEAEIVVKVSGRQRYAVTARRACSKPLSRCPSRPSRRVLTGEGDRIAGPSRADRRLGRNAQQAPPDITSWATPRPQRNFAELCRQARDFEHPYQGPARRRATRDSDTGMQTSRRTLVTPAASSSRTAAPTVVRAVLDMRSPKRTTDFSC